MLLADKLFLPGVGTAQAAWIRCVSANCLISSKPVPNQCGHLLRDAIAGAAQRREQRRHLLGIIDEDVPKMTDFGLPLRIWVGTAFTRRQATACFRGLRRRVLLLCSQLRNAGQSVDLAQCNYGEPFTAAVQKDNFYACSSTRSVLVPLALSC